MQRDDLERVLFTQEQIGKRVEEIGKRIEEDYRDKNPLVVGILKGASMFFMDVVRCADIPMELDFMAVSSYGKGATSSGNVRIRKDLDTDIRDRHVLLCEDIIDSGVTMKHLFALLSARGPASLRLCSLLSKPSRRRADIAIDYCGWEIPDAFVVGYGLDYAEKYRNLPYIGVLKPEIYS